jgi:hypothetical protein
MFLNLRQIRFNVTKLDLSFDNVPFTPEEFYQAILDDMNRAEAISKAIEFGLINHGG